MSTDYDVRCKTCNARHGLDDNRDPNVARALIVHRDAIAALVPLMQATDVEIRTWHRHGPSISPAWFAEHAGHELAVFDEYGGEYGTCREHYSCGHCKAHHYCDLPVGHTEPHGKAAK